MIPNGKWVGVSEAPEKLFQIIHTLLILPREEKREGSFETDLVHLCYCRKEGV